MDGAITVLTYLEESAEKYGKKCAVIDEKESMTYEQLLQKAKLLGYALQCRLEGRRKKPVILFMEKSCKCLATMLGVLYSGNIYVPVDMKTPMERLNSISGTLESEYMITTGDEKEALDKMGYLGNVFIYEDLLEEYKDSYDGAVIDKIQKKVIDTDLMYILFTSGSTGVPKGVAVMHRSVIDYINAFLEETLMDEGDVVGNQTPFYVDMSLKDIYMSIKAGATICIIPQKYFMSPKKLLQYLDERKVTFLAWVPTAYRIVAQFDGLSKVHPSSLKHFLFSGEAMPVSVFLYWRNHYPDAVYTQQYGPTEITGACTSYHVIRDYNEGDTIPIGKPFRNTGIILLDANNQEVAPDMPGIMGEICVFGSCLAAGYYNNPEKTEEAFVQNPLITQFPSKMYRTGDLARWDEEGNLVFVSRKDYQVKHSGRRIELGEIEAAAMANEKIKACCCVHERKRDALVLYYIGDIGEKEIIQSLQDKIPKYMIPTVYFAKEELPVLPNGKLNRKLMDSWANHVT